MVLFVDYFIMKQSDIEAYCFKQVQLCCMRIR